MASFTQLHFVSAISDKLLGTKPARYTSYEPANHSSRDVQLSKWSTRSSKFRLRTTNDFH